MEKRSVEFQDVAKGLWIWRVEHPDWVPNQGWDPIVASTCVKSGDETYVLDPIAPEPDDHWKHLKIRSPFIGTAR